jgi:hypothetical protein
LRGKIGVHSHFSCDRTNLIGTKRFLNLLNRLVFTMPTHDENASPPPGKFIAALQACLSEETARIPMSGAAWPKRHFFH